RREPYHQPACFDVSRRGLCISRDEYSREGLGSAINYRRV
ncbi:hypothetical protein LINGRAHAP2_LOCUS32756, partial [Linum grandiflorum]